MCDTETGWDAEIELNALQCSSTKLNVNNKFN